MAGALMIGTVVWIIVAVIAGGLILNHVSKSSPADKRESNRNIALLAIIFSSVQLWLMWITCYMHQMYPLISPKIQH